MPAIYYRDPSTGLPVPVIGNGMTQANADVRYVQRAGGTMTADPTVALGVATKQYIDNLLASVSATPTGVIAPYAGAAAPTGWLLCNGATVSRTTYAALFAVCSTTYGVGDGTGNTFSLPNLIDRAPVGAGSAWARGTAGGAQTHTNPLSTAGGAYITANGPEIWSVRNGPTVTYDHWSAMGPDGGAGFWNNTFTSAGLHGRTEGANHMPPFLALNYIIKT